MVYEETEKIRNKIQNLFPLKRETSSQEINRRKTFSFDIKPQEVSFAHNRFSKDYNGSLTDYFNHKFSRENIRVNSKDMNVHEAFAFSTDR